MKHFILAALFLGLPAIVAADIGGPVGLYAPMKNTLTPGTTVHLSSGTIRVLQTSTFTVYGVGAGQRANREGPQSSVHGVGTGAIVDWADSSDHTWKFNPVGIGTFTVAAASGTFTVGHSLIANGPYSFLDSGLPPASQRYDLEHTSVAVHLDAAGNTVTDITITSTATVAYNIRFILNNTSSVTATGTYFDLAGSSFTSLLANTPLTIFQGVAGANTSEIDLTNILSNSDASLGQKWYAGTGFDYPIVVRTNYHSDATKKAELWIDPTHGVTVVSGTNTANAFAVGSINGPYVLVISTPGMVTVSSITANTLRTSSNVYVATGSAVGFDEYQNGAYAAISTITWQNGNKQAVTLTANTTFNFVAPDNSGSLVLRIATGAGSFTGTWPAAVLWSGGSAPTITATASKNDIVACYYSKQQAKYYCATTQNF